MLEHERVNFVLTNCLPRRPLSRAFYRFSRIESPWVARASLALWKLFADVDLSDARESHFNSLHAAFTRELRPGARPLAQDRDGLLPGGGREHGAVQRAAGLGRGDLDALDACLRASSRRGCKAVGPGWGYRSHARMGDRVANKRLAGRLDPAASVPFDPAAGGGGAWGGASALPARPAMTVTAGVEVVAGVGGTAACSAVGSAVSSAEAATVFPVGSAGSPAGRRSTKEPAPRPASSATAATRLDQRRRPPRRGGGVGGRPCRPAPGPAARAPPISRHSLAKRSTLPNCRSASACPTMPQLPPVQP